MQNFFTLHYPCGEAIGPVKRVRWETNGTEQPGGENEVFLLSMETPFGFIMGEVRASLEMEGKCVCVLLLRVGNVN